MFAGFSANRLFRSENVDASPSLLDASNRAQAEPTGSVEHLKLAVQGNSRATTELRAIAVEHQSINQVIALSNRQVSQKLTALEQLRGVLVTDAEPTAMKTLMRFTKDADTARAAIAIAANLPGTAGGDLLYALMIEKTTPPEIVAFADQLLRCDELRTKVSSALKVVLDLRNASTCEERKAILETALLVGDQRLVRHVVPLTKKNGCGSKKNEDCFPCLRAENQKIIRDVLERVQTRNAPYL
jgi:hypothetical protein